MPSLLDANRKIKAYTRAREHRCMERQHDLPLDHETEGASELWHFIYPNSAMGLVKGGRSCVTAKHL